MFTFPKKSYTLKNSDIKYKFLPTVGYVIPSCCFSAIASRTLGLTSCSGNKSPYHGAIFGTKVKENQQILRYLDDIIQDYLEKGLIIVREHNKFNLTTQNMIAIEHFVCSLSLFLHPMWYNEHFGIQEDNLFQKQPFQQLILLDKLATVLSRSDVGMHADLILMEKRQCLGLGLFSFTRIQVLLNQLNNKAVCYVVPRRHGKTKFINCLNGLCIALFPQARLKMLYVAQTKDLTIEALQSAIQMTTMLRESFNRVQKEEYDKRLKFQQDGKNEDFYYFGEQTYSTQRGMIICTFRKQTNKSIANDVSPVGKNSLSCIVYQKENVSFLRLFWFISYSIFFFSEPTFTFLLLLKTFSHNIFVTDLSFPMNLCFWLGKCIHKSEVRFQEIIKVCLKFLC